MKVFVTGVNGQLGHDVINELLLRKYEAIGSDIQNKTPLPVSYYPLDITNETKVKEVLLKVKPDVVIHCSAYTQVDNAQDNEDLVDAINHLGTKYIASICKELDCKMVYISTDYVFNGLGTKPWDPDCKEYEPLNIYGKTKLAGEIEVSSILNKYFIVRIAWVFGTNGNNFINTMINLSKKYDTIKVVNDQIGTPTYTYDLSKLLVDMIDTEEYGYYHATNEGGYISWYEFALEIFKQANINMNVIPVSTVEYGLSKAKRPYNSRLDKSKLVKHGFKPLPTWQDALKRYLNEKGKD